MNFNILIPIILGCIGILQGTINRQVASYVGVTQATLLTNLVTVFFCFLFYFFVKSYENAFPPIFSIKAPITTYKWWFIFPAIFGFMIVAGMPYAISKLGAVKVTVGLITAQMITSVAWDFLVDGVGLNIMKISGIICAFLSVALITLSK